MALPETIDSEEEARSYFEDVEYRPPINSPYDCTGLAFTAWYRPVSYTHLVCVAAAWGGAPSVDLAAADAVAARPADLPDLLADL